MSRLDFCQYELVDDCYDWKNDNCDECNIFKAYCEGARRAKNLIVRCKDCRYYWGNLSEDDTDEMYGECRWDTDEMPNADDFCSYGERREP